MKKYVPLIICVCILVGIGMLSTILPYLYTPGGRAFNGMNGYSSDYIQYTSYIKSGMYGRYYMVFRSFPFFMPKAPIHFLYILAGIVGNWFGANAPFMFHAMRVVFGSIYVFLTYKVFTRAFPKSLALISTFLAFVSTPLGLPKLSYFNFSIVHPERVTDRPHYLLGAICFLVVILLLTRSKRSVFQDAGIAMFSFLGTMVHISSGIILLVLSLVLRSIPIAVGTGIAMVITYYFVRQYTLVPEIWLDSYVYSGAITIKSIVQEIISFGPTLWFGFVGFILVRGKPHRIMFSWLLIQLGLFMFGYTFFHVDRVRFLQALYFIPMTYGTVLFWKYLSDRFSRSLLPIGVSLTILLSLPVYIQDLRSSFYYLTDYRSYSTLVFPTDQQMDAFRYLDRSTPMESLVLASYDIANNILLYSHNYTLGNNQGWSTDKGQVMLAARDTFYRGVLTSDEAHQYLLDNRVQYVYYGYQEKNFGDITRYPFLESVYSNPEVTIYKVL